MSELHEATIEWVGNSELAPLFLAASQRSNCVGNSFEKDGEIRLTVKIQHTSLQSLRDIVDALLIEFAEIEEGL
jgi:hypothetical protein